MTGESEFNSDTANGITLGLINELAENGLGIGEYQLYQFVDPDALAQLLDSIEEPYHISFHVKNKKVIITETGISVQHS